jgi:SAM-dependent methyltransferase
MTERPSHWTDYARNWSNLGRPLCPHREDVAVVEEAAAAAAAGRPFTALLLGVTPELAGGQWPPQTRLLAIDKSRPIIGALWPASGTPDGASAICAEWSAMPLGNGSVDFVAGDGCLPSLAYPEAYLGLFGEVHRILRGDGRFVTRLFVRREEPEAVDAILAALEQGRIVTVHELKWRLLTAMHGLTLDGVRLGDVWDTWHRLFPRPERLAEERGWRLGEVLTVDHYRGLDTRYHLATLPELSTMLGRFFEIADQYVGTYGMAEICPTLTLLPRRL